MAERNITRVLNMTMDPHDDRFPHIEYLNLGLDDMSSEDISTYFERAHQFLSRVRDDGAIALVHCHMGKRAVHQNFLQRYCNCCKSKSIIFPALCVWLQSFCGIA